MCRGPWSVGVASVVVVVARKALSFSGIGLVGSVMRVACGGENGGCELPSGGAVWSDDSSML